MKVLSAILLLLIASRSWALGCTITATPIDFGSYNSFSAFPLDTTADVKITCDSSVPYILRLDAGANSGGTFSPRKMLLSGGGDALDYNLYRNSARTEIWGDGTNGSFIQTGAGTGTNTPWFVYGRMPGRQNVGVGTYADTITVTIEW